jgi:hypothetical protein
MTDDLPTDRYFPAKHPKRSDHSGDVLARSLAVAAILLAVVLYILSYRQEVKSVERDRAACVREERDLQIERTAWETLETTTGLEDVSAQVARIERIIRRSCDERFPDPGLL